MQVYVLMARLYVKPGIINAFNSKLEVVSANAMCESTAHKVGDLRAGPIWGW